MFPSVFLFLSSALANSNFEKETENLPTERLLFNRYDRSPKYDFGKFHSFDMIDRNKD